jgi:tetratricopeptide (TPR) repeat protein
MTTARSRGRVAAAALVAVAVASCARPTLAPAPSAPRFPDFVFPAVPAGLADRATADRQRAAWAWLQSGDLESAERGFSAILIGAPGFYPAQTGLGYVELARQAPDAALRRFGAALEKAAEYAPALAGRGDALLAADRAVDALASFEAAAAADPDLVAVRGRIEVLRFRAVEAEVARARQAAEAKRYAEAQQAYERALAVSPESAFLRRELAAVQRETGRLDAALTNARRAVDLDPSDARAFVTLGEIHAARTEFVEALGAFERAESIEPNEATRSKIRDVRERARLARLPDEYRSIPQTKELTRAQLAALVAVRLDHLVKGARSSDAAFITDTRGGWAEDFILRVARAGVMEVYPNYTFQPGVPVRRGELASVVSRLLTILADARPALADRWRNPQYAFSDLTPGHLSYPAAALAVTSGVMPALEGNTFQLSRIVTGAEAIAAVERIEKLTTSR